MVFRPSSTSTVFQPKRVQALYDCEADNKDELTFVENEIIVVTGEEDQEWWVSTRTDISSFTLHFNNG